MTKTKGMDENDDDDEEDNSNNHNDSTMRVVEKAEPTHQRLMVLDQISRK